ncbi:MAG: hypothetical protein C4523_09695 [Myxococcales bacterium]|nr:MAG: hypothetical protein C4523_09695 [Myxococcales bacterium]
MKFKIDENLPIEVAAVWVDAGHDAETVAAEHLKGADDRLIYNKCSQEGRILVTLDLDFANVQHYPPGKGPGVIVLRLPRQDKPTVLAVVQALCNLLIRESPSGKLWIVEEKRVRVRE